jgi:hypothetical protein
MKNSTKTQSYKDYKKNLTNFGLIIILGNLG